MSVFETAQGAASTGFVALVFAVFCAYWAQETERSAWLWFFFGLLLPPIAAIALLSKNAVRRERRRDATLSTKNEPR